MGNLAPPVLLYDRNSFRDRFGTNTVLLNDWEYTNSWQAKPSSGVYRDGCPEMTCLDFVVVVVSCRGEGQVDNEDSRFYKRRPCIDSAAGTPAHSILKRRGAGSGQRPLSTSFYPPSTRRPRAVLGNAFERFCFGRFLAPSVNYLRAEGDSYFGQLESPASFTLILVMS